MYFLSFISVTLLLFLTKADALRKKGVCHWLFNEDGDCAITDFRCSNGACIDRKLYCNKVADCEDGSDEKYCDVYYGCPASSGMIICPGSEKCVPENWFCDGIQDCFGGLDEYCDNGKSVIAGSVMALLWLKEQKKSQFATDVWGRAVDKLAVALYLGSSSWPKGNEETMKEMAYELSIQLLSRLSRKKLEDIPSYDLASYLNAFLVTCVNPRDFHGLNIVRELRSRVDTQNYTNPYLLLSLCNAGDTITESDKVKLVDVFKNKRRAFWTDIRAFVIMALACANKQGANSKDSAKLKELIMELKQQYINGTTENVKTTALVMQAIFSTEPDSDDFDEDRAMEQMVAVQETYGSFGGLVNTYYILPVFNCKSLVNISSDHCEFPRKATSTIQELASLSEPKIRVSYSIWIGNDNDLEKNLALRVPVDSTFFKIMEIAADLDSRYRFDYVVHREKPYVNALFGLQDDPEKDKFWFLYKLEEAKPSLSKESPVDVIPKDNEHFVMWYRSGTWVE